MRKFHRFAPKTVLLLMPLALAIAAPATGQSRGVPEPKKLTLTTRDGFRLGATYFPSKMGREAVPVVMLQDYKENRAVFNAMAEFLQAPTTPGVPSLAVITVDLRGHGDSTKAVAPNGSEVELTASRLKPVDFENMVLQDMEAVRRVLVEENDAGRLNLNKLTLLGTGMGANVAVIWAAQDWATPPLATRKQGQDVKALVLFSPQWKFRGLPLLNSLRQRGLQREVSFFIAYGEEDRRQKKDADLIYKNLEPYHPEPAPDQVRALKDLFLVAVPSGLQGTDLLNRREFRMPPQVGDFILARVAEKDFPWVQRKD